jgi:nucleoside phosphorylase
MPDMTAPLNTSTYFSHSYRPEDRALNEHLWAMFASAGFAFTVDPESIGLSITQLELMMRRSDCFVAVATYRPEQAYYQTSPYVVFEYGLAIQAGKPALVLAETGVAPQAFEPSHRVFFKRDALSRRWSRQCQSKIRELAQATRGLPGEMFSGTGSAGVLLPPGGAYTDVRADIHDLLERAGYAVVTIKPRWRNPADLLRTLDQQDFVLVDVGEDQTPSWVFPLLYGRATPTLRLMYRGTLAHPARSLPELMLGDALGTVAASDECAVWWSERSELLHGLEREIAHLKRERTQFRSFDEGIAYFHSLGRASDGPVFVSNAAADNPLAREITRRLEMYNVRVFHYQYQNTIERGEEWSDRLLDKVRTARLFVALISSAYWNSSWCRAEYDLAIELWKRGTLDFYPYFLEDQSSGGELVLPQGTMLAQLPPGQQTDVVVVHVEEQLMKDCAATSASRRGPSWTQEPEPRVDIALVTMLQEEYEAVLAELDWHGSAPGSERHPNEYAWEFGEIGAPQHDVPYRVVLAMATRADPRGAGPLPVRDTIEAFRPRYVLLVGIAGGRDDVALGDVVVSNRIHGYEHAAADGGFRARPDWIYPTDGAVIVAAQSMRSRHPGWWRDEKTRQTQAAITMPPAVHVGAVASGTRVVDDLTDPYFRPVLDFWPELRAVEMEAVGAAQAIQDARELGHSVNFAMVRGIAHLAGEGPIASNGGTPDGSPSMCEQDARKVAASRAAARLATQMIRLAWSRPPRPE